MHISTENVGATLAVLWHCLPTLSCNKSSRAVFSAVTRFILTLFVCFSSLHSVRAWNAEGHMIVAQIAYNHLNPIARAKCDALIATPVFYASNYNNTFVTAACWADDIRSAVSTFNNWHFINIPFSLDGAPTNSFTPPSFDVVQAIQTNIAMLQNPSATLSNQAVHLRFLLHFVGDIQQPLHCSTAITASRPGGDFGGNSFSLSGGWGNLHSLWDGGGGFLFDSLPRPLSASAQQTLNARVAAIEASYPYNYSTNLGLIPNPMTWALEGYGLAQTVCYVAIAPNSTPSSDYLNTAQMTTGARMAKGGHRLADLLNTIYPMPPIHLSSILLTNGNIRFSWSAVTGGVFRVQWKGQLAEPAWNTATNITAFSSSISFTDALTQTQRFYRVMQ